MDAIVSSSTNWKSDPAGRIRNISLAPNPKNALFPLFEAIMNSIQAIEERFGRDHLPSGRIQIEVVRGSKGECQGFRVFDNGIGFNPPNLESFVKMDSQKKADTGGKGVGRLLWLKVLEKVSVESRYEAPDGGKRIEFEFCLADPIRNMRHSDEAKAQPCGTTVNLFPYREEYARSLPQKSQTVDFH